MLTPEEVRTFASDIESDRVERTISTTDTEKFREAICAFSNDMPGHGKPGYLMLGVADDGRIPGINTTDLDQLLRKLADRRDDGKIEPIPSMTVYKVDVEAKVTVVVVEVQPSDAPPVRASGRIWIRVGPRKAIASRAEERILVERRISRESEWDGRPCVGATTQDLALDEIQSTYIPNVVAADVLAQNERSLEDRLASLRLYDPKTARPSNAGIAMFGTDPLSFFPGAYIQFVRFDGTDLGAPAVDSKRLTGSITTQLWELNLLLPVQLRVSRTPSGGLRQVDRPDYPLQAIREFALNAVMHRTYESTNTPVRVMWFSDRVEIQNPGGLYGRVTAANFGKVPDYRNPIIAEVMQGLGYVEKWGSGIARARASLAANGNPPPEFDFQPEFFQVTVKAVT